MSKPMFFKEPYPIDTFDSNKKTADTEANRENSLTEAGLCAELVISEGKLIFNF